MIDLAEMKANILFSFTQIGSTENFIEIDPRMGRLIIFEQNIIVDEEYNLTKEQNLFDVQTFTPENFSEYFEAGVVPDWLTSWGAPPLTSRAFLTEAKVSNRFE